MKRIGLIFSLLGFFPAVAWGQRERADIRQGNKAYYEGKYPEAEVGYKRAIEKNINSYEANFNLAGALYKQERYDDAAATYEKLAQDGTDVRRQAATYYNMGNTALRQRKIDRAIEAYKRALRLVPDDREAKLNLAYAQKLKQQEEQQNQNQNQDQNKDQQKQDQKQDQNKDKQKDQKQDEKKDQQQPPKSEKKQDNQMSKENAEQLLNSVMQDEKDVQDKVKKQQKVMQGGRLEKDW